jgi:hypothetical protein
MSVIEFPGPEQSHEAPAPIGQEAQPETLRHTISEATVSLL